MMACDQCDGCIIAVCDPGVYSASCNLTCNSNCRSLPCATCTCEVCNLISGNCTNDCHYGWYGARCGLICPDKCQLSTTGCDRETGSCLNGCQIGFYGDTCNSTCSDACAELLCEKANGRCVKGCIDGYEGEFCGVTSEDDLNTDEIAGAAGGAFVVILWATVVVILIFVIWKRRLKDTDVFSRNSSFGKYPERGSSRRHARRHSSNSSINGSADQFLTEELLRSGQNRHRPLQEKRSVTFETDHPVHCTCSHGESRELFVCHGGVTGQEEYEQDLHSHLHEYHVHFTNGQEGGVRPSTRLVSSEGDISQLAAAWNPRTY